MSVISKIRRQKAVYWPKLSDGNDGKALLGDAVEIDCRWEDRVEMTVDQQGRELVSSAFVYVDRAVTPGGFLWQGRLTACPYTDPAEAWRNDGAREIKRRDILPNFKNTENLITAVL